MRALILPLVSLPRVRVPGSLIRLGGDYQLINDDDNHCHNSYHWERFIINGVFDISKRLMVAFEESVIYDQFMAK